MRASRAGPLPRAWERWKNLFAMQPLAAFALCVCLVLGSTSAVAWAAEVSLPGDFLYPVKTGLNEPIVGFLKGFSLPDRVAFEWELVERRLMEAEELAEARLAAQRENIVRAVTKQRTKAETLAQKLIEYESRPISVTSNPAPADSAAQRENDIIRRATENREPPSLAFPRPTANRASGATQATPALPTAMPVPPLPKEQTSTVSPPAVRSGTARPPRSETEPEHASRKRDDRDSANAQTELRANRTAETGEKTFKEMDRIFEKHQNIIRKLDLPPPYIEARMRERTVAAPPQKF